MPTDVHCKLAIFCDGPPSPDVATCWSNSSEVQPDSSNGMYPYSTTVAYSCLDGRKFYDGTRSKLVTCAGVGNWTETNVNCMCRLKIINRFPMDLLL